MEKEKILSTLTEKLGTTQLSSRTLDTYISNNLPAEGVEPDDAYFKKHVTFLQSLQGQFSHDVSMQVEDFKKNYKPQEKQEEPVVTESHELQKLLDRIAALEVANAESEKKLEVGKIRSNVLGKAGELNVANYKNEWEDAVNSTNLSDCKTEDEALDKVKKEFERIVKRYHGDGAKPYGRTATTQQSEGEASKKRSAYLQRLQNEGLIPKEV